MVHEPLTQNANEKTQKANVQRQETKTTGQNTIELL
jgi:hypothetical protein